jgi:hypothetical protein
MGIGEELWLSEVGFRFGQLPNPMIRTYLPTSISHAKEKERSVPMNNSVAS